MSGATLSTYLYFNKKEQKMPQEDGVVKIRIDTNAEAAAKQLNDVGTAFKKNADTIQKSSTVYSGYEKAVRDNIEVLRELALGGNQNTEGFRKLAEQTREYKKALDEANSAVEKSTGGFNNLSIGGVKVSSVLKGIGWGAVIKGVYDIGKASIQTAAQFEQLSTSFRIMAGSAAEGQRLTDSLIQLAAKTPMTTESLSRAAQTLLSFGESTDSVIGDLKLLGDITGGEAQRFQSLALAFAQVGSTGRLTGQDLMQMVNQGFNPLQIMSEKTGKSMAQLKKEMADGKISFDMVKQAMIDATSEGGRFYGLMNEQSETLNGKLSTMSDTWQQVGKSIGDAFLPMAKWAVDALNTIGQATDNVIKLLLDEQTTLKDVKKSWDMYWASKRKVKETLTFTVEPYLNEKKAQETAKQATKTVQKGFSSAGSQNFDTPSITPVRRSTTASGGATSQAKQIKDAYDLANEAVEKARRAVYNTALQFGASSPEVAKAFEEYKQANDKISGLQDIFKTEETKTRFQQLQQEISNTTAKLQDLYLSGQGGSDAFVTTKNHLSELQTQLQDMNTAITSNVGLSWDNVANSIRSSLTSALMTPLQKGESAFDRLGKIGLNVVQAIGQEIISNLLKQVTLQTTLKALGGVFSMFGGGGASLGMAIAGTVAKNGKVFNNGKVVPFARGGVVNKPTLFPMANGAGLMGEAGPEAVMPLTRKNGKLGVEASGGQMVVNIYNQSGASVETQKRDDGTMDIFIKKFNSAMSNERTSGAFRNAYQRESAKGVQAC